ncbi:MAG: c-type cytochrome, partial [Gammaproteobacteria bacterium]
ASSYLSPPPRDFTALDPAAVSRERFIASVTHGRPGTAMMGFARSLSQEEIAAVVDFVLDTFVRSKRANTRYHTPENGWQDHQRYHEAYPFALGEIPLDRPDEALTPAQRRGKALFMSACITCHDRGRVEEEGAPWEPRAVSYPRGAYAHRDRGPASADAVSGATPYARHDVAPRLTALTAQERRGERLFQDNCAFCHGADGSGRNWIGSFLQPHPRDLTDARFIATMNRQRLREVIREGLPDSTMPSWKHVLGGAEIEALVAYVERAFFRNQDQE